MYECTIYIYIYLCEIVLVLNHRCISVYDIIQYYSYLHVLIFIIL